MPAKQSRMAVLRIDAEKARLGLLESKENAAECATIDLYYHSRGLGQIITFCEEMELWSCMPEIYIHPGEYLAHTVILLRLRPVTEDFIRRLMPPAHREAYERLINYCPRQILVVEQCASRSVDIDDFLRTLDDRGRFLLQICEDTEKFVVVRWRKEMQFVRYGFPTEEDICGV